MRLIEINFNARLFGDRLPVILQFAEFLREALFTVAIPGAPPLTFRQYLGSRHGI